MGVVGLVAKQGGMTEEVGDGGRRFLALFVGGVQPTTHVFHQLLLCSRSSSLALSTIIVFPNVAIVLRGY